MISAKLEGGLGNQMFQIATTYATALDHGDECGFDFYWKLERTKSSGRGPSKYKDNVYSKLQSLPEGWKPEFVYDEPNEYKPIPYQGKMLLRGYLCWPQYFNHRRKEVIDLFKNKEIISTISGKFENSVSLHVRRGNYVYDQDIHPMLQMSYYQRALQYIESKTKIDHIYIFTENKVVASRDLEWCKENFKRDKRSIFVTDNLDYYDMYIMSFCKHHIIANSSFSWWGSYLSENEDKIICSPKNWFGPTSGLNSAESSAFFCSNWTLIDN